MQLSQFQTQLPLQLPRLLNFYIPFMGGVHKDGFLCNLAFDSSGLSILPHPNTAP